MAKTAANRRNLFGRLFNYANNFLSIMGIVLTTVAAILIIVFIVAASAGAIHNPYMATFAFIVLPAFFILGLIVMPIGMWRRRKLLLAGGASEEELSAYPDLDFNNPHLRKVAVVILGLTAVNGVILGSTSYLAVQEMDTVAFCGTLCHTVMQPEYTAYQQSPHSRVQCVECHIGPGASWFVKSKLDGLRQVWKTVWNTYERPIKTPISSLRPARETCEQCHWPARHYGDKLAVFARTATDETNTPSYTAMLIKTGGGLLDIGGHSGIHWWHIYSDNRIRYVSKDPKRQDMLWVEITTPDGKSTVFVKDGEKAPSAEEIAEKARLMDCIDCHDRPTHLFQVPAKALDDVLERFPEARALPYFKREALKAVKGPYPTHGAGMDSVRTAIMDFYSNSYPDLMRSKQALVELAANQAAIVYGRSVFPEMKTNWETHPNNIGHEDFPGCWRCHGGDMTTADGATIIPADCDTCHEFLVQDVPTKPDLGKLVAAGEAHTGS
jgi:nitrate/TMAO reductase-like tetraheme cytochrome c subunit